MKLLKFRFAPYKYCRHNLKRPQCLWVRRVCYWLRKLSIGIFLLLAISIIAIFISPYRPFETRFPEDTANKLNDLIFALSCSYVAAWIFFMVTDYMPSVRKRMVDREYVKSQLGEIKNILKLQVEFCIFLTNLESNRKVKPKLLEFVKWYTDEDLFRSENEEKSRYLESLENCYRVRNLTKELLFGLNKCLNFDDLEKLKYLWKFYKVDENLDNRLQCVDGKTIHDERYLKLQAIVIYKAYEVMNRKYFKIPKHGMEQELRDEFFENRCHCLLNGTLCNGDYVTH